MPIIKVDQVTKEFQLGELAGLKTTLRNHWRRLRGQPRSERERFKALDQVSFSVDEGEVLGIIGHNGAGKSTLLKLLARISQPTSGRVTTRGRIAPLIEVGAGFVGQLTGRENIYLNGAILGLTKKEIDKKFDDIVEFAEMGEFIDTPIKRYSSGMKVKLAFSVATSVDAEILIVDEVLAVGDLAFQQKCIERMERLIRREGRTVLIVGHNIRQLQRICSRMLLMDHGRIAGDGSPQDICGRFFRETQERNLARVGGRASISLSQHDSGVISVDRVQILDDSGAKVESLRMHEPITIEVTFTCQRPLPRPEIVIGLQTSDFIHALSVSNALPDVRPDLAPGTHKVRCRLSDIPLRPLPYTLRLGFLDQFRHLLWYSENLMSATVVAGIYDITRLPESGLVDVPAEWEFTRAADGTVIQGDCSLEEGASAT